MQPQRSAQPVNFLAGPPAQPVELPPALKALSHPRGDVLPSRAYSVPDPARGSPPQASRPVNFLANGASQAAEVPQPAHPQRKGPSKFLRTVGRIGDAMALMGGRQPVYEQQMRQRAYRDALAEWQADPNNLDARNRMIQAGGEDALNLVMRYGEDQRARQKSALDMSAGQLKLHRDANRGVIEALSSATDQIGWDAAMARAEAAYAPFGIDVRSQMPAEYPGPEGIRSMMMGAMDFDDRLAAMDRRDRLDWDMEDDRLDNERADRNTTSLIGKRNQPPAPRAAPAPRAPTASGVMGGILKKVADGVSLSRGEQQLYDKWRSTGRGGRGGGSAAPPAATTYQVGQTATDPKTGKKVSWNGKGWVPVR